MMTQSTTHSNPHKPGDPASRDPQRAALEQLVHLSAESAETENQIEATHSSQIQSAQRELKTSLEAATQRHEEQKQQIEGDYEQRIISANLAHDSAIDEVRQYDNASRQRLSMQSDSATQELTSKYQQAVWLAESVFEGTQNQLTKEARKSDDDHANRTQELTDVMNESSALIVLYGQPSLLTNFDVGEPSSSPGNYADGFEQVKRHLATLSQLGIPRLFVGVWPFVAFVFVCFAAAIAAQIITGGVPKRWTPDDFQWIPIAYATGGAVVFCIIAGIVLRIVGRSQVRKTYTPLRQAIESALIASDEIHKDEKAQRAKKLAHATKKRDGEIAAAKEKIAPYQDRVGRNLESAVNTVKSDFERRTSQIESQFQADLAAAEQWRHDRFIEINTALHDETAQAQQTHDSAIQFAEQTLARAKSELKTNWDKGLVRIQTPISRDQTNEANVLIEDWNDPRWQTFSPPNRFASRVRFGQFQVDLPQITDQYPRGLKLPERFSVPASLAFPNQASMLIHTDHAGHADAIRTQQLAMARLLTQLPPGRVRFTIIDPIGLGQNFAGFMHLADHDEALVGSRIWTESAHIEQQLANLTEHMETVIQKYLRNEFATIDDYNAQAGELAEPYRYLIIADFPVGFEGDSFRRLNSIATSGARCGVFFIIVRDLRIQLPAGVHIDELQSHAINLERKNYSFVWRDEVFSRFPLTIDPAPEEATLTRLLETVGRHAKQAKRVEVPFESIAPKPEQFWSGDSSSSLEVPIGRLGATRLQTLRLGRGVAQHALIAGKTGSGKSTLLHILITNLSLWYSPDQVEFYLVDFKKGVEFKTYATHQLPHARAIAVESDREFGLSVLQRIDAELARRGEMFRKLNVQDLASYRAASGQPMPRTLLIIDEFQEFFSEDDKLAQEAALLIDRLVRQGRAFGIHVLLGSQTIGGASGLPRSTLGQMAVRIALQTSEADSQLILGDSNSAARLLSRPGEAIYNDAGGLVEGNSPFQISWLSDQQREGYLDRVKRRSNAHSAEPIVFEGNQPADMSKNKALAALRASPPAARPNVPLIWLGEPVAIKEPTAIALRPQSGANMLVIGQTEEPAMALLGAAMISLAAQHPREAAKFYLLDGTPADSTLAGILPKLSEQLAVDLVNVDYRAVPEAIAEIAAEVSRRQSDDRSDWPRIFVVICGLQRYRMLRKSEESFSFSTDDAEKKPAPDKQFTDILREGPAVGVHVLSWIDTAASIDRTFDRNTLREFDNRVLFQMSAADSSNLVDSPIANKLGFNRALAYSEELGTTEKFRPYALARSVPSKSS
jgi:hypothetical protein